MLNKISTGIILVVIILFLACEKKFGQQEYTEIEKTPKSEKLARFSSYPVEKQIDIYLFSRLYVEGTSDSYNRYLASDGINKIPPIVKRIDESSDPMIKTLLINVIELIGMNCHCIVDNEGVIQTLEKNKMPLYKEDNQGTKMVKETYNAYLQRIKSAPAKP